LFYLLPLFLAGRSEASGSVLSEPDSGVHEAVDKGLRFLASHQASDGSWKSQEEGVWAMEKEKEVVSSREVRGEEEAAPPEGGGWASDKKCH
jgi:hypothetical protein